MKAKTSLWTVLAILAWTCLTGQAAGSTTTFPEFEFDVWASPPSREVYSLTQEPTVQRILYTIREKGLAIPEIAAQTERPAEQVQEKLNALGKYGLVRQDGQSWQSSIPMYVEAEIRATEQIGQKYAEKQAQIMQQEMPALKRVFQKTVLSRHFAWDHVSLIIVGALMADFCVVDRIPFMPDHYVEGLQPSLVSSSGKRWAYDGFQKLPKRFPSRKWKFYQNQYSKYSGGLSRFGDMGEQRPQQPARPEGWIRFEQGKILFALGQGALALSDLQDKTGLKSNILNKGLDALQNIHPPAVVCQQEKYQSSIPILCAADLDLLLPECDRIAATMFTEVVRPHFAERVTQGRAAGSRWPLPADTYVRDRALQILIEKGQLGVAPSQSLDWNFGVWGWQGFLRMHDEIKNDLRPDPFLLTSISDAEARDIKRLNRQKQLIFTQGAGIADATTPANAFLTWISAYAKSDLDVFRLVATQPDQLNMAHLQTLKQRGWLDFMRTVDIRRLPPVPEHPQDGDVCPVFTMHERGYEEAYLFFYYQDAWRHLGNTSRDGRWHTWARDAAQERVRLLRNQERDLQAK